MYVKIRGIYEKGVFENEVQEAVCRICGNYYGNVLAACGSEKDPDDIDEKDFESMAEKLDDMSDEEIEDMFEDYE